MLPSISRYSDFMVHEIDRNGCTVTLDDVSIPLDEEDDKDVRLLYSAGVHLGGGGGDKGDICPPPPLVLYSHFPPSWKTYPALEDFASS